MGIVCLGINIILRTLFIMFADFKSRIPGYILRDDKSAKTVEYRV